MTNLISSSLKIIDVAFDKGMNIILQPFIGFYDQRKDFLM